MRITLIEVLIIISIIGIGVALFFSDDIEKRTTQVVPEYTELCISGFKFIRAKNGTITQILSDAGAGVVCYN